MLPRRRQGRTLHHCRRHHHALHCCLWQCRTPLWQLQQWWLRTRIGGRPRSPRGRRQQPRRTCQAHRRFYPLPAAVRALLAAEGPWRSRRPRGPARRIVVQPGRRHCSLPMGLSPAGCSTGCRYHRPESDKHVQESVRWRAVGAWARCRRHPTQQQGRQQWSGPMAVAQRQRRRDHSHRIDPGCLGAEQGSRWVLPHAPPRWPYPPPGPRSHTPDWPT
mmetsp:Transcript_3590/g.8880  ORF Transcript_3590/g.8880 Transcript_3590/m.8880 type:complete len:218 (+) Transcript_3590:525-1178(+)